MHRKRTLKYGNGEENILVGVTGAEHISTTSAVRTRRKRRQPVIIFFVPGRKTSSGIQACAQRRRRSLDGFGLRF